jgi:hypothetical protein
VRLRLAVCVNGCVDDAPHAHGVLAHEFTHGMKMHSPGIAPVAV